MGIRYKFMENAVYSAEDVNAVFLDLMTPGVLMYKTDTVPIDPETALEQETENRLDLLNVDGCRVVCEDGKFMVLPGIILLEQGPSIRIEASGYVLDVPKNQACKVYACFDAVWNHSEIRCDNEMPEDGILLAEIDDTGAIHDKRVFSYPRMNSKTVNLIQTESASDVYVLRNNTDQLVYEWEFPYPGFHFAILDVGTLGKLVFYLKDNQKTGFCALSLSPNFAMLKSGNTLKLFATGNPGRDFLLDLGIQVL